MTPAVRRAPPGRAPALAVAAALMVALAALAVYAAQAGFLHTSAGDVLRSVAWGVTGDESWLAGVDPRVPYAVVDVRLPRVLAAGLVGASLALAGAMVQGVLLNPLAEPYTLGISAGAAFGAALAIVLNLAARGGYSVAAFAFAGACATLVVVLALSSVDGQVGPTNLVLSGIIVAAILGAGIGFLKYLADENVAVIVFWLMGSLAEAQWTQVVLVAGAFGLALAGAMYHARDLNVLALGTRTAVSLGVDATRVRLTVLALASLATAACVSAAGIIAFVGLIVPHLVRFVLGPDAWRLLPVSALAGAVLLLGADTVTRAVLPHEVPVGILTALIGGPVFCALFRARARRAGGSHR